MVLYQDTRKDDKQYIIVLGYWVCNNQKVDFGLNNTYNQQYWILHQQGTHSPDPRTTFLDDLIKQIQQWQADQKAVLVCIDTNENPQQTNNTGITRIFQETDLYDLHVKHYPQQKHPPTYNQGLTPIDLCAGSPEFAEALIAAWYLPFGLLHGLKGDHQTLGLDFAVDKLFQQSATMLTKHQHEECTATTSN